MGAGVTEITHQSKDNHKDHLILTFGIKESVSYRVLQAKCWFIQYFLATLVILQMVSITVRWIAIKFKTEKH